MTGGAIVVLNGELLPRSGARIRADDAGFLLGDGVFETLRADAGRPQLVAAHLERLERSSASIGIRLPWRRDELRSQIGLVLEANALRARTARVRITVTRGPTARPRSTEPAAPAAVPGGSPHAAPSDADAPTVLLTADAYQPPPAPAYAGGVDVVLSAHRRSPHPLDRIKSTSRAAHRWLRREALEAGAFDALQFNVAGLLAEGSCTNVFLVGEDRVLRTPAIEDGCLEGVTRACVLQLAAELGFRIELGGVDGPRLQAAGEVFLTNSLIEVLPVRRAGGWRAARCPGPVTEALCRAFAHRVHGKRTLPGGALQSEEPRQGRSGRTSSHE